MVFFHVPSRCTYQKILKNNPDFPTIENAEYWKHNPYRKRWEKISPGEYLERKEEYNLMIDHYKSHYRKIH